MSALTSSIFEDQDINKTLLFGNSRRSSNISPNTPSVIERRNSLPLDSNNDARSKISSGLAKSLLDRPSKIREVYRFNAEWLVSSVAWSNEVSDSFHLAISSFIENYSNRIQIITLAKDSYDEELQSVTSFEHPYPATKVSWIPNPSTSIQAKLPRLLATTADYLRLWRVEEITSSLTPNNLSLNNTGTLSHLSQSYKSSHSHKTQVRLESLFNTNKGLKHCAPLTSFDWNDIDPNLIVTSSIDSSCTVWDIEVGKPLNTSQSNILRESTSYNIKNHILVHSQEVYDVSFSRAATGRDIFVSVGGEGKIKLTDLRRPNAVNVLFETEYIPAISSDKKSLVRVCCNKQDPNYVSAFETDSKEVLILDLRSPGKSTASLNSHTSNVNSMSWAPHSAHHICTASDDQQALIWEVSKLPNPIDEPLLAYRANGKINTISWSLSHSNWIAIGFENYLELLRV